MSGRYVLYLFYHGEADCGTATGDFKRQLTPKGHIQIHQKIKEFKEKDLVRPDCVLCSTASRTKETALLISDLFKGTPCFYRDSLYLAPAFRILDVLKEMDDMFQRIMVIAHRRGMEQVGGFLAEHPEHIKFKNGMCLGIELIIPNWRHLKPGVGKIIRL